MDGLGGLGALDAASWIALVAGGVFLVVGGIGLLRMPDCFSRLHAAGLTDTLGAGLVVLGLLLQAGPTLVGAKLVLVFAFLFFTAPTASHALAKAALHGGERPRLGGDAPPAGSRARPEEGSSRPS